MNGTTPCKVWPLQLWRRIPPSWLTLVFPPMNTAVALVASTEMFTSFWAALFGQQHPITGGLIEVLTELKAHSYDLESHCQEQRTFPTDMFWEIQLSFDAFYRTTKRPTGVVVLPNLAALAQQVMLFSLPRPAYPSGFALPTQTQPAPPPPPPLTARTPTPTLVPAPYARTPAPAPAPGNWTWDTTQCGWTNPAPDPMLLLPPNVELKQAVQACKREHPNHPTGGLPAADDGQALCLAAQLIGRCNYECRGWRTHCMLTPTDLAGVVWFRNRYCSPVQAVPPPAMTYQSYHVQPPPNFQNPQDSGGRAGYRGGGG